MLITYNADGTPNAAPHGRVLKVLILVNAVFALTVVFGWTLVSLFISEPMAWATWHTVSRGTTILELFAYPFSLLWVTPALGIMIAWLANKSKQYALAHACVLLPILFLGLICGWFYFTPEDWR